LSALMEVAGFPLTLLQCHQLLDYCAAHRDMSDEPPWVAWGVLDPPIPLACHVFTKYVNPFACFTPKSGGTPVLRDRVAPCSFGETRGNELTHPLPAIPPNLGANLPCTVEWPWHK
jgi:hypothetical protein